METNIKTWLSRNTVGVLIALLAVNFIVVYWSTGRFPPKADRRLPAKGRLSFQALT